MLSLLVNSRAGSWGGSARWSVVGSGVVESLLFKTPTSCSSMVRAGNLVTTTRTGTWVKGGLMVPTLTAASTATWTSPFLQSEPSINEPLLPRIMAPKEDFKGDVDITPKLLEKYKKAKPPAWKVVLKLVRASIIRVPEAVRRYIKLGVIFSPVLLVAPLAYIVPATRVWWWRLLSACVGVAGPCFIKLGQWATTRPDLFSPAAVDELKHLQAHNRSHPFSYTEAAFKRDFGASVEQLFARFDRVPIASGSVAQVYRARTKAGLEVAVKVRHPGIEDAMVRDIDLLHRLCKAIDVFPAARFMNLTGYMDQFAAHLLAQLDLADEARNLDKFSALFHERFGDDEPRFHPVVFPKPVPGLVSPRILVESFERGLPVLEYANSLVPERRVRLAETGVEAFLSMLLVDNFTHGDLHPGNILVRSSLDKKGKPFDQIVFIDAGICAQLNSFLFGSMLHVFESIVKGEAEKGAEHILMHAEVSPDTDMERAKAALGQQFRALFGGQLRDVNFGEVMTHIFGIIRDEKIILRPEFATVFVSIIVLEGLGRILDPELNLLTIASPFILTTPSVRSHLDLVGMARAQAMQKIRRATGQSPRAPPVPAPSGSAEGSQKKL